MSFTNGILEIPISLNNSVEAILTDDGWNCSDPETLAVLNRLFPYPDNDLLDFSPVNPCAPCDLMSEVERVMGATIKQTPESTDPPNTIY